MPGMRVSDGAGARHKVRCAKIFQMSNETVVSRLSVDVERDGTTAVVRCGGKLVAGVNDFLYTEVHRLIPESNRIVLDLTELSYMDSMGLGTIIRLYVSAKAAGCELELVNIGHRIRELLGVTNLLSVFTVCGEHHVRIP
jgi:anti-sigma B factor antagonist